MGKKKKSAGGKATTATVATAHYDADTVRSYAHGQWSDILPRLCGFPSHIFDGKHHPCPKPGCTAQKDGFRFTDRDGDGSGICNTCCRHEAGNGFKFIEHFADKKFAEAVRLVGEHLGVTPRNNNANHNSNGKNRPENVDPAECLTFREWDENYDTLAAMFCLTKKPITVPAIKLCGGRIARYKHFDTELTVIAIPVWGENLTAEKPVGWSIYNITGGTLPGPKGTHVKVKLTYGSTKPGIMGPVDQLATATEIWKLEGPSDLLAFYSLENIPSGVVAITNKSGAGEKPVDWILHLLTGKRVYVLHDADEPGQRGAIGYRDEKKKWHRGWCGYLQGSEVFNVILPYAVESNHGKDLRDYLGGALKGTDILAAPQIQN